MSGELISPDAGSLTAERQKNEGIIDTLSQAISRIPYPPGIYQTSSLTLRLRLFI